MELKCCEIGDQVSLIMRPLMGRITGLTRVRLPARPSVCLVRALNSKTKKNVEQLRSNVKAKVRVVQCSYGRGRPHLCCHQADINGDTFFYSSVHIFGLMRTKNEHKDASLSTVWLAAYHPCSCDRRRHAVVSRVHSNACLRMIYYSEILRPDSWLARGLTQIEA